MPRRATGLHENAYYHVFNRGVNRCLIFLEDDNYRFFMSRLKLYTTEAPAEIIAYCLMPTHYHLLIHLKCGELSSLMHRVGMSYANALNKRHNRVGPLFQGRFQAKLVEKDEYLLHLSRYIHLNPVAAGLVGKVDEWPYSSFQDFVNPGGRSLAEPEIVLDQFGPSKAGRAERIAAYRQFVEEPFGDAAFLGTLLFQE